MKIALVTSSFLPQVGGAEMVVHNLALQWVRQGYQVCVINVSSEGNLTGTSAQFRSGNHSSGIGRACGRHSLRPFCRRCSKPPASSAAAVEKGGVFTVPSAHTSGRRTAAMRTNPVGSDVLRYGDCFDANRLPSRGFGAFGLEPSAAIRACIWTRFR